MVKTKLKKLKPAARFPGRPKKYPDLRRRVVLVLRTLRAPSGRPVNTSVMPRLFTICMSQKELDDFTDDEWTRFPQALINKYVKSFAAKCARCARRGGKC